LCVAVPLWVATQFLMSHPDREQPTTDGGSGIGAKVIDAKGSFATKEVVTLLAGLGKHLSDGGEKIVIVSGQHANPNWDRIVGILKLASGDENIRDIRLPQSDWGDASVVVKLDEGTR
jgi:hypothetical protein